MSSSSFHIWGTWDIERLSNLSSQSVSGIWKQEFELKPSWLHRISYQRGTQTVKMLDKKFKSVYFFWKNTQEESRNRHSVQLLSRVQQASPSIANSRSLLRHVHQVSDAIKPSHPLSYPSPPAFSLSQHQDLFQGVSSSHQVAKVLEFQLQNQSFQWIFRTDFL